MIEPIETLVEKSEVENKGTPKKEKALQPRRVKWVMRLILFFKTVKQKKHITHFLEPLKSVWQSDKY